jgi:formate/nitrite transporter FocA (FNT family)
VSDERRRELGSTGAPVEDEVARGFEATVSSGAQRVNRSFRDVIVTGLFGGLEVGVGVMGYLAVLHQTNDHLLAGIAFGIGFVALLLAHSELFTENFLMPIAAVVAKEGTALQLARLWIGTLVANLVGGWLFMWLVVAGFPQWRSTIVEAGRHYVDAGFGVESVVLATLAGSTMTLMTRMQEGTESDTAKVFASMAGGFLLAGLSLFHSILDSLLIFGAIHEGSDVTYWDWLRWFGPTVLFNIVGGVGLVTALRLLRSKELVQQKRHE